MPSDLGPGLSTPLVIDLHCDLLCYLASGPDRTPLDDESRASLGQLEAGGVTHQIMAVFTDDNRGGAVDHTERQVARFAMMMADGQIARLEKTDTTLCRSAIAVENAAGLCRPDESVADALSRLDDWQHRAGRICYVSLTWAGENRFGGGNGTTVGLKPDGERLLQGLAEREIAIDFSHTSDKLADDILDWLDRTGATTPILASHSNLRAVNSSIRNLPDELAQAIAERGGVIGLSFIRSFVGGKMTDFVKHVEHGLELGLGHTLAIGADFFYEWDVARFAKNKDPYRFFFEGFTDASSHRIVRAMVAEVVQPPELAAIAGNNARRFLGV